MEDMLKTFTVPDNTTMEEHSIVTDKRAIIGNHASLGFGIIADSVIIGERVRVNGNVIGIEEVRIDMWSSVNGDVRTKNDAYIGEFVNIGGKLIVGKDLDIGKDVEIKGGYEARGWIIVRNPIPVIIYIFLYLTELLRMGKDDEVDNALKNLFSDETDDIQEDNLLIIPSGSKIDLESIKVPDRAVIGSGCRMMGNIRAASIKMGKNNTLFGSIRTASEIVIDEGNTIHGNLVTRGEVHIRKDSHIIGEINGGKIIIHEEARVDGAMRAANGVLITRDETEEELKTVGLLDMVPEPAAPEEIPVTSARIKSEEAVSGKAADETVTTGSGTRRTGTSGTVKYNIPAKRLTTAIRLGDIIGPVPVKKETANRTATDEETSTAKKKKTSKKITSEKPEPKKTVTKKKTTPKKAATKEKISAAGITTGSATVKTMNNKTRTKKTAVRKPTKRS